MVEDDDLRFAIDLATQMGDVMRRYFEQAVLKHHKKPDGTIVTEADTFISYLVCRAYATRGRSVVSEEGGTAEYGHPNAEYQDPIDDTADFEKGRRRTPRRSTASFSLGSVRDGQIMRGVVNAPPLMTPRLYWAQIGSGAFRVTESRHQPSRLRVDDTPQRGIVLVTDATKPSSYIQRLSKLGFTAVGVSGSVLKACCVADPNLFHHAYPGLRPPSERVVGFVSEGAYAHDYAAAAAIVRMAGGFACGTDGGALRLTDGKNGCIFAINMAVRDKLIDAMS